MDTIIAFPEDCILTEGRGPKNRPISSLSKHGSDVSTPEQHGFAIGILKGFRKGMINM
jgi:hypothetical protein